MFGEMICATNLCIRLSYMSATADNHKFILYASQSYMYELLLKL